MSSLNEAPAAAFVMKEQTSINDLLVHSGRPKKHHGRQVNLPIELGSTNVFDTMEAFEEARDNRYQSGTMYYGRYGNEASFALESTIAQLESAAGVTLTSSGLSAITLTLLALTQPETHLLVADNVYTNTRAYCDSVLVKQRVIVEYFDPMAGESVESLIRSNTVAIMFEAPGSGTFEFPDIRAITSVAKSRGVITVLDGTWTSPVFCQSLLLDVDVLVYSGSKYLCGHSDCMLGVVASAQATLHEQIRRVVMAVGDKLGAQEVFLTLRGLRTLELRMQKVDVAGRQMAQWFDQRPEVKSVLHPAMENCSGHRFWQRDCTGAAGLFSVVMHPCTDSQIKLFVNTLEHFCVGVSWGGFESLVLPISPVRTATQWNEPGPLIRFNIGFEELSTLQADLDYAMQHLNIG